MDIPVKCPLYKVMGEVRDKEAHTPPIYPTRYLQPPR